MSDKSFATCPVCEYNLGTDGSNPDHYQEICSGCGIQFGYNDAIGDEEKRKKIYQKWRELWIQNDKKPLSSEQGKEVIRQVKEE
jgi:hypothetical protein